MTDAGPGEAYSLLERSFHDTSFLKAHKALPRTRIDSHTLYPAGVPLQSNIAPDDETSTRESTVDGDLGSPIAPNGNGQESGLPPTPPSNSNDEEQHTESKRLTFAEMAKQQSTTTPINQRSPPTPDPSPPRTNESLNTPQRPAPIHYASSRAESFRTAREHQWSSDDESSRFGGSPTPNFIDSARHMRRRDIRSGLTIDRGDENATPTHKQPFAADTGRRPSHNPDTAGRAPDPNHTPEREWDANAMRNVTIRRKRAPRSPPRLITNIENHSQQRDTPTTSSAHSNPDGPDLDRSPSNLDRSSKAERSPHTPPSMERFVREMGWPHEVNSILNSHLRDGDLKRLSTASASSTVVEAVVVVTPPQRQRTLRRAGKNLALRRGESPSDRNSLRSGRASFNSEETPPHRLVHKRAGLSDKRRLGSSGSDAAPSVASSTPSVPLKHNRDVVPVRPSTSSSANTEGKVNRSGEFLVHPGTKHHESTWRRGEPKTYVDGPLWEAAFPKRVMTDPLVHPPPSSSDPQPSGSVLPPRQRAVSTSSEMRARRHSREEAEPTAPFPKPIPAQVPAPSEALVSERSRKASDTSARPRSREVSLSSERRRQPRSREAANPSETAPKASARETSASSDGGRRQLLADIEQSPAGRENVTASEKPTRTASTRSARSREVSLSSERRRQPRSREVSTLSETAPRASARETSASSDGGRRQLLVDIEQSPARRENVPASEKPTRTASTRSARSREVSGSSTGWSHQFPVENPASSWLTDKELPPLPPVEEPKRILKDQHDLERRRISADRSTVRTEESKRPSLDRALMDEVARVSFDEHALRRDDPEHHRISFDRSTVRTEEHAMARHLFAQSTPFSQFSDTPDALEVSEATAVSIYPHNNHSLLVVQQVARSGNTRRDPVPSPFEPSQPSFTVEPSTPPEQIISSGFVDSPLKNPRKPPVPPAIKFIPPTPAEELERPLDDSATMSDKSSQPQRRMSLVQKARRYSDTFIQPLLNRSNSLKRSSVLPVHQPPSVSERDENLHPFWRPRGFWDDFSDSDCDDPNCDCNRELDPERDRLPPGGDTSNVGDDRKKRPWKIATENFRSSGGFLIGNSLGVERQPTNNRRHYVSLPLGLASRKEGRVTKRQSASSLRSQRERERRRAAESGPPVSRAHTLPGLGLQVQYIGIRGIADRIKEKRAEKRRDKLRKSIGSRFMVEGARVA